MRIFFPSATEYLTDVDGHGEGLIAWNLLSALADRGHQVVACIGASAIGALPTFEVVQMPKARNESLAPFAYSRAVSQFLQSRGADTFDVAHWLFPDRAPGLSIRDLHGLPLVLGPLVRPWPDRSPWWPAGYLVRRVLDPLTAARSRRLQGGAARILASTDEAGGDVHPSDVPRLVKLPFGTPISPLPVAPLPDTPRVLFVGRLEERKGIFDLVAAIPIVLDRSPHTEFVIAGSGDGAQRLANEIARLGVESSVTVMGQVNHSAIPELMGEASVICVPSYREPFGMVILEAMERGRAVVSTTTGGPKSIIDGTRGGRLVRAGDVSALGRAIADLLSDAARLQSIGAFNRTQVLAEYAINTVAERLEIIYAEAAASSG